MTSAGACFMFGFYSNDIKYVLGYDQTTINLLAFFKDLGADIGIHSGLINKVTPPCIVLIIGAALNFVGYFMVWLAITRKIAKPQVWHMCLYITMGANSHTFINTRAIVTCVKNLSIRIIRIINATPTKNETRVLHKFLFISLGMTGFLLMITLVEQKVTQAEYGGSLALVLFFLFLLLGIVVAREYNSWRNKRLSSENHDNDRTRSVVSTVASVSHKNKPSCWKNIFSPPEIGQDYTIPQVVLSIEMITLFLTTLCGIGGMLTMMDNLGEIGTALGYSLDNIRTFVSITSIWTYLGQVIVRLVSDIVITKYKCPRPLMFTLSLLLSCIGHLLIAFDVPNGLYVVSIILGFCFGVNWPLIFAITSEIFGLKHCSTLTNVRQMACPLGSFLINVNVTGFLCDKEAEKQLRVVGLERKHEEGLNCTREQCYRLSFIIITDVAFLGALISLVLVVRTRKFYISDVYNKYKDEAAHKPEIRGGE